MNTQDKFLHSSKWSFLTEIISKLFPPIVNMVLARLLTPEAFGLVATITMVTSFAELFADGGVQKFLIQHPFESDEEWNKTACVAFWVNLSVTMSIWLIICVFRNELAAAVGNSCLGNGIAIASAVVPISAFSSIQMSYFRRSMDFKTLFYVKLITLFVPLFVTIPLACMLKSYWAIILGNMAVYIVNAIVLMCCSTWKPKPYFSFDIIKRIVRFSVWTFLEQFLGWANLNIGIFIVGKFLTEYYLGLYKTSMSYVNQVMWIIPNALSFVLISAMSKMIANNEDFRSFYYNFHKRLCMIIAPLGVGIFVFGDLFVGVMLGGQWTEAVGFVSLWALMYSVWIMFGVFNNVLFVACGKPVYGVISQGFGLILLIPVLLFAAPKGYEFLYTARSFAILGVVLISLILLKICLDISPRKLITNALPFITAALAMGLIGFTMKQIGEGLGWQFFCVAVCIVAYFTIILSFPRTRKLLIEFIQKNNL